MFLATQVRQEWHWNTKENVIFFISANKSEFAERRESNKKHLSPGYYFPVFQDIFICLWVLCLGPVTVALPYHQKYVVCSCEDVAVVLSG